MKYKEDQILDEIKKYIESTYTEHYSTTEDGFQVQDMLRHLGIDKDFCQANAIKYLARYLYPSINQVKKNYKEYKLKNHKLFLGDSYDVLKDIKSESIDGAVTSPPYYNAKEYSQWENIFTYLSITTIKPVLQINSQR